MCRARISALNYYTINYFQTKYRLVSSRSRSRFGLTVTNLCVRGCPEVPRAYAVCDGRGGGGSRVTVHIFLISFMFHCHFEKGSQNQLFQKVLFE